MPFEDVVTTAGPRPSWMPLPSADEINVSPMKDEGSRSKPRFMLTSTAIGPSFQPKLKRFNNSLRDAGFDEALLWNEDDVLDHARQLKHPNSSALLGRLAASSSLSSRPYCAAFKPLQLWFAMKGLRDGDYVMWADASKHHDTHLRNVDVRAAARALVGHLYEKTGARAGMAKAVPPAMDKLLGDLLGEIEGDHEEAMARQQKGR